LSSAVGVSSLLGGFFFATVVSFVSKLVFFGRLVVPCGGFFLATVIVIVVIFELVFFYRLVIPCGGFLFVTVPFLSSNSSSLVGLLSLAADSLLRQSSLSSSNLSSLVGLSLLVVDSSL
jgi:hypothetical protein